ncbi:MAG: exodeoxyribonuclease VII large subunit [Clostridia bacterium]|nr:exodeoxyribonuclease VII large subunit [Clostridia bacterium]
MKTLTLSVLQFNTFVKNILDAEVFLSNISIVGEVTNFKVSGGNAYFDLKDENASVSCVKFGAGDLDIKNGDLITVFGKVNFYVKSGRINFIVARTQAYGLGDLYQKFLELKSRLEKEGFFREEIKKPIPNFSRKIGVVTSETGAVIRDIINVARGKNKFVDIIVFPSKVQGVGAEDDIVRGIEYFNSRDDIDVIIVARGGGSLEDLAPFNTERVVKGIYASNIPVISAVGHETDFTLCDFAADLRVPTPSVASEVAVFDYKKTYDRLIDLNNLYYKNLTNRLSAYKEDFFNQAENISKSVKLRLVETKSKTIKNIKDIENNFQLRFQSEKHKLEKMIEILSKLNPLEILKNGYAFIEKDNKKVVSAKTIEVGDEISVSFSDGKVSAVVNKKEN